MFREMRRIKQLTDTAECVQVLNAAKRGVLAVNGEDGYPYAMTLNFVYSEKDNRVYFHCAGEGLRTDCLAGDDRVCFTCTGNESREEDKWYYTLTSVIIRGRCRPVTDAGKKLECLRSLAEKYCPSAQEVDRMMGKTESINRASVYEIEIEHITGKHITEK